MPPGSKENGHGSSDREASPSACENIRVVLVPCHAWKCVPKAISSGVDISDVPGCHVLRQMSSQWGSQKLLQRLVSYELAVHLSVFNLFFMAILWEGCKPGNFESNNSLKLSFTIFEAFVRILLNVNLSLNQTFLTFLPCVRQTWLTQLILAISPWEVIFLWSKRILVLICMVSQCMWKKDFLLHGTYL